MAKRKKRGPGRPWDKIPRVSPRISRAVRFPPEDYKELVKAAKEIDESLEGFIKEAIKERVEKILK